MLLNSIDLHGITLPKVSNIVNLKRKNASMNIYTSIYDNLVTSSKHLKEQWEPIGSGLERHHIVPVHAGGTDEESNFTYLTHREHIIAHWLLWKIHRRGCDEKAWMMMSGVDYSKHHNLGKKHPEESKAWRREFMRGNTYRKGKKLKKPRSEEYRKKMSKTKMGNKVNFGKGRPVTLRGITFETHSKAAEYFGVSRPMITKMKKMEATNHQKQISSSL